MRFGSVCSGIEAASVAWEPLGWSADWFSEIDRAASQVLAYRFPDVPNHGDMTQLPAMVRERLISAPDVLVGGTPCQAFSIAGRREGLNDARGQLTLAYVDLGDAIDEVRISNGDEPCIIVWENVPGVLSSKDNAFGCFLAGLAGEDEPLVPPGKKWTNAGYVLGPKRAVAWRIQDAQYHGLAQRRRRVFVVASAREGFDPAAILFEFDGVRRDIAPSREAGEGFTHATAPCLTSSGRGVERTGDTRGQDPVVDDSDDGGRVREVVGVAFGGNNQEGAIDVATACNAHGGPHGRLDFESETFVVQRPICFSSKDYGADAIDDLAPTLRARRHAESHPNAGIPPAIAYAIQERAISENPAAGPDGAGVRADDRAYTLEARAVPQAVAYSVALRGREGGATAELGDDVAGCLRAGGGGDKPHVLASIDAVCVTEPVTHTLKGEGFDASEDGTGRGQPIVPMAVMENQRSELRLSDETNALRAGGGKPGQGYPAALVDMAVRRLMPVECERLQGFPDGWTLVPTGPKGKLAADGPRYKQCGNSMAVKCMNWIGRRIQGHLSDRLFESLFQ